MTITPELLDEKLAALPPTARETADVLHELGVKGRPFVATSCPLANYLRSELPGATRVSVSPAGVGAFPLEGAWCTTPLPAHLLGFVHGFDAGYFPELIDWTSLEEL